MNRDTQDKIGYKADAIVGTLVKLRMLFCLSSFASLVTGIICGMRRRVKAALNMMAL